MAGGQDQGADGRRGQELIKLPVSPEVASMEADLKAFLCLLHVEPWSPSAEVIVSVPTGVCMPLRSCSFNCILVP